MASTIINLWQSGRSSVTTVVESLPITPDRDYQTARQHDREQHRYQESLQFPEPPTKCKLRCFRSYDRPVTNTKGELFFGRYREEA